MSAMAAGPVTRQGAFKRVHQLSTMILIFHIDKVRDNDAADIPKPSCRIAMQPPCWFEQRLLKIAFAKTDCITSTVVMASV